MLTLNPFTCSSSLLALVTALPVAAQTYQPVKWTAFVKVEGQTEVSFALVNTADLSANATALNPVLAANWH